MTRTAPWIALFVVLAALRLVCAAPAPIVVGYVAKGGRMLQVAAQRNASGWTTGSQLQAPKARTWRLFTTTAQGPDIRGDAGKADAVGGLVVPLSAPAPARALAVSGAPARQPRHGRDCSNGGVSMAVTRFLRQRGLNVKTARLTQVIEVDLQGDGSPEHLVCASSRDTLADPRSARTADDYALAAIVWSRTPAAAHEPTALAVTPLCVQTRLAPDDLEQRFDFVGLADLDGSGRLTAALHTMYYEGEGIALWGFDGRQAACAVKTDWGP